MAHTAHGEKAADLIGQLTSLMQASGSDPASISVEDVDADMVDLSGALEEVDDAAYEALADAQADATRAGKSLTKDEPKEVLRSARATANAAGKFSVIMRSKKANGKAKLVGDSNDGA